MAIQKVIRMGHPTLRVKAEPISQDEIKSDSFKQLITDLFDTMEEEEGIGIAAPQIGISKQVAIVGMPDHEGDFQAVVVINPKIEALTSEVSGNWEGCLSVPGLRGYVERPHKIKVNFLDIDGNTQEIILDDFGAIVFQHECDHLIGKLYVDHIKDPTQLMYLEEYMEFVEPHENEEGEE